MNKKNWIMKVFMTTCLFIALSTNLTFASGWTKGISKNAWWFDFGNGDYFKSSWQWIDGNQDGIAECYCFDENGWMYENTITPDGYTVNENGAWTINNVVQTKTSNLIPKNNTNNMNNGNNTASNNFTETKNNNLTEIKNNEDFSEKQDEYRADLLRRVNKYRDRQGLNTLEENDYLNEMAQTRAEELSVRFSHIRPNGELASGYGLNGEIATNGSKTPKDAFLAFKVSKQHNKVMLDRDFLTFGSGYYVDGNGKSYWIILFSDSPQPENLRQQ